MASTSETGHAKNVAHFKTLIEFVSAYGAIYNPSKSRIQLPQMIAKHTAALTSLAAIIPKNRAFNIEVNFRFIAFSDVRKLSTRLMAALEATDASEQTIADAKTFNNKIQGKGPSKPKKPLDPNDPPPDSISTSQQSYDQLIQHLSGLKAVLESEPSYAPNEVDLQIASLDAKIADLTVKNDAVATVYAALSNARIARDKILYTDVDSIFETAKDVKPYVKSIFGATSPEYAQIKGIEFKKPKK